MMIVQVFFATLRLLLALVFTVSAVMKLADREGFQKALASFAVPERLRAPAAVLIPVLELLVGIGLLPAVSAWPAAISALGLLLVFTVAVLANLARGRRPDCHCFGQFSSAPVSWRTVLRNGVLMAAAAAIVVGGPANTSPSMLAWVAKLSLPEVLGLAAVLVIVGAVSIETWVLAHVLRQNGRLLLRLDALEAAVAVAAPSMAPADRPQAVVAHAGLPQGVSAPTFQLDRLDGGITTSAELLALGKPVALTFLDPDCGPCTALLPELERWQRDLTAWVTFAVITSGTVEANKRKFAGRGLQVLLQKKREINEAYRAHGTPSMVLVKADGTIGSPVAGGRDAVRALMAPFSAAQYAPGDTNLQRQPSPALNGGNSTHNVGRIPTRIGETVPDLRLPDLNGKQVSLAAFRGHAAVVLFWNPGCGFCQRMLEDLKAWEANRSDASPQLLVISTGSPEANRVMGLRSPVLLDEGFGTGRTFGAGGTPSAVLIDGHGRIASELAVGGPSVLALVEHAAPGSAVRGPAARQV
jgi:thiol-disulfide isomerase/thioredoxin/uncharacterized membrane protein YphA (DoxX/SURF4 family)